MDVLGIVLDQFVHRLAAGRHGKRIEFEEIPPGGDGAGLVVQIVHEDGAFVETGGLVAGTRHILCCGSGKGAREDPGGDVENHRPGTGRWVKNEHMVPMCPTRREEGTEKTYRLSGRDAPSGFDSRDYFKVAAQGRKEAFRSIGSTGKAGLSTHAEASPADCAGRRPPDFGLCGK